MGTEYQYFIIPYEAVNTQAPGFTVWYATWSNAAPTLDVGMNVPLVVGCAEVGKVPANVTLLGNAATKTPPIPSALPPPPALTKGLEGYQQTFDDWIKRRRSL